MVRVQGAVTPGRPRIEGPDSILTKNALTKTESYVILLLVGKSGGAPGQQARTNMDVERPRKRHTKFSRAARAKRILEQLREGWAYDDIAREEGLTARRVRQIVAQFIKTREALGDATHAHMQIDRLSRAMRVASDALAQGDIRAIGPFIRVTDRLDRYQALAQETKPWPTPAEDQLVVQQLVARIRRQVEDELAEKHRKEAE